MSLRARLLDFKKTEERSYRWIAEKIGINEGSLQKFGSGQRDGMCIEFTQKLIEFLNDRGY